MEKKLYNLSYPQKSILLTEQFYQNTSVNNICGTAIIDSKINFAILKKAINSVIKNNDSFRIHLTQPEMKQYISEFHEIEIEIIDIKYKEDIANIEQNMLKNHFSLFDSDLFEFKIFRFDNQSGGFILNIHHIISDAWTLGLVCRKIVHAYDCLLKNITESINLEQSYIKFIENEFSYSSSTKFIKDKEYWESMFSNIPNIVNIYSKSETLKSMSCAGNRLSFTFSKNKMCAISAFCKEYKISIFNFFMAVLSIYIYKFTNTNDFVIGTPILNRTNFNEKNTTGMFINIAPLLINIKDNINFKDFISNISINTLSLLKHQRYPYAEILKHVRKQDPNFPALFNILLSYQVTKANNESNLAYTTRWAFNGTCADDIDIQLYDLDETGELNIAYDYKIDKYEEKDINDLHLKLSHIIEQVIKKPDMLINDIELISNTEKKHIIFDFNKTETEYSSEKTIVQLFEEQVKKTPNNIAVKFENSEITYKEINQKANSIAHFLRTEKNVTSTDFIGIILNRSIDLITSILGVVKAGATYVAIDPEYPQDRIEYMLANCNAKIVFTNATTSHIIQNPKIDQIDINFEVKDNNFNNPELITTPEDLLYIIYTSGSTGKPKGVSIKNKNVNNFIVGMKEIIDFSETKKMLSVATVCFDMFVFELWGSLLNGLTLILANEEQQKLPNLLNKLCLENSIDIFQTTPSRFKLIFDNECTECFSNIKHILVGGEAVPKQLFEKFLLYKNLKVHHMYGPTETTVWSTHKLISDATNITIGKPISNIQIYILDNNQNICPIGVAGEIYISGDGVGNGYLYQDELNKNSFIKNPFVNNSIMYKTGDLGIYSENGEIVYLNRIDHQVKIRGFRIELDEIEKIILDFPNIKNCVVVKKELHNSHEALCAYYIEKLPIDLENLKKLLQQKLPAYMVPQYFFKLNDFPYTQNGKIDRKSLPIPEIQNKKTSNYVGARNNTDEKLLNIINKLLEIDSISITDNLFELGMDSLIAINLSIKIMNEFNIQLNIPDIFHHPVIANLSNYITTTTTFKQQLTIQTAPIMDSYPLSSAQKRIYYASLVSENESTLYNVSGSIIFEHLPDYNRLNNCLKELLNRHEIFKTYFQVENNEIVQKISNSLEFNLIYEKVETDEIDEVLSTFIAPFDLSEAPLFRAKLVEFDNGKSSLLIDTHHIICDGASLNILIRDLCALYNIETLPKLNITYKDYSVWEKSQETSKDFKDSENFWIEQFKDTIPVLNLPTTFSRPANKTYNGNLIQKTLDKNIAIQIKDICKTYHTTPNIILLCAYYILLHKYTGQNDIIIGTPIIGRTLPELDNIVGMFVNTLPLRNKINPNSLITTFFNNVKDNCAEAFSHQDYPFDRLVSKINAPRDNSRNFLFDVLFTYQTNNYSNINFKGLKTEYYRPDDNTSKFDLSLEVVPFENTYNLTFEYCTSLFDKNYIEQFSNHYLQTIHTILDNINTKISDISILTDKERNTILYSFNNTAMQYNAQKNLSKLFEEQVQKTPDNIAIVFEEEKITYQELNKRANQIAWFLNELGLGENSIIGIMLPRSLEVLICMLGALKAGVCYIPIDPTLPESRIEYMLKNSNSDVLLTFDSILEKLNTKKIDIKHFVDVNLKTSEIYNGKYKNIDLDINPESSSYIIYTSGSTGKPKGVMLNQKALTNLTNYLNKHVDFLKDSYANTAMVSITTISFDIFIFETLICLQRGLKIIMANENEQNTPALLDTLIQKNNVKCIQMTPSRMALFLKNQDMMPHLNNLEYITLAGEALPKDIRNQILKLGDITIYNGYGPSETTVFSTFTNVTNQKEITIGKPLGNTQIYILDKQLQPVPINQPGELYISGDGVAIGYVNNESITKERFIPNPFINNSIMYKTGDLAKFLPDGELDYIGRIDNQVKIRGLRIELDEIEKAILKYKNIEKCIISAKKDDDERQFIIAYLLVNKRISIHNLREFLKELLPKYMIPTYFVILDSIPYLPNGKIDKKSLPEPDMENELTHQKYIAPKTKLEIQIVNIFQNLLSISPIGIKDNFFELGGDSLLAINLQIELSKITNAITYADIFLNPTVSDLISKIKQDKKENFDNINCSEFDKYNEILEKNNNLPKNISKKEIGNILISGTTGFLGAHILKEFLENENGIAYCIIRPESGLNTTKKLLDKLHYYFDKKYDQYIGNRIIIVDMDISKNNLDFSSADLRKLSENVSCIINCAAKVAHFGKYELFKKVNVDGVQNLLKFSKKYNKRFYQISTVSVSETNLVNNVNTDKTTFYENNLYINQSLNNVYIKSKFEAEKLVLDYILEGTDAYILRVGNLMNRFSDLKFQPNIDENAFISRLQSFIKIGALPKYLSDEYLEFTPIDCCAEAILKIIQYPNAENRIFHLFNQNHVTIKQFIKVLQNYKEFSIIKEDEFLNIIDSISKTKLSEKILSGIIKDFDTNKKIHYRSNVSVNNDFSNQYLEKLKFKWPIIDNKYLNEFIKYILDLK